MSLLATKEIGDCFVFFLLFICNLVEELSVSTFFCGVVVFEKLNLQCVKKKDFGLRLVGTVGQKFKLCKESAYARRARLTSECALRKNVNKMCCSSTCLGCCL